MEAGGRVIERRGRGRSGRGRLIVVVDGHAGRRRRRGVVRLRFQRQRGGRGGRRHFRLVAVLLVQVLLPELQQSVRGRGRRRRRRTVQVVLVLLLVLLLLLLLLVLVLVLVTRRHRRRRRHGRMVIGVTVRRWHGQRSAAAAELVFLRPELLLFRVTALAAWRRRQRAHLARVVRRAAGTG